MVPLRDLLAPCGRSLEIVPSLADTVQLLASGSTGRAYGEDPIPNEVYKLCPAAWAREVHPLFCKVALRIEHPLLWKGGMLHELVKSAKGSTVNCDTYRGVLLGDHLGKKLHRFLRRALLPHFLRFSRDTQCGGLPRRSTDFAAQMIRLFLEKAKAQKRSAAVLFVDVKQAFDSVVRAIALMSDLSLASSAALFARLGLPPAAFQEFLEEVAVSALQLAEVPPHLHEMLTEIHSGTWASVQGVASVIKTALGTKPGHPLGDILYNFVVSRVFRALEYDLTRLGVIDDFS